MADEGGWPRLISKRYPKRLRGLDDIAIYWDIAQMADGFSQQHGCSFWWLPGNHIAEFSFFD